MSVRDSWRLSDDGEVTCIACGDEVPRSAAREYDKYGDRWDRDDKRFESLCKPCHREYCHQPRDGLEAALVRAGAGTTDTGTFLEQFAEVVAEAAADREADAE